jgi:hypothetical protein
LAAKQFHYSTAAVEKRAVVSPRGDDRLAPFKQVKNPRIISPAHGIRGRF